jgi:uncharacterized peroxidase-related enzyme
MVDRFARDWRSAGLDDPTMAVLEYSDKLTRRPADMTVHDIDELRRHGLSDRAINDVVQVCAYFNYINRIADGLGIVPEDWIDELGYET